MAQQAPITAKAFFKAREADHPPVVLRNQLKDAYDFRMFIKDGTGKELHTAFTNGGVLALNQGYESMNDAVKIFKASGATAGNVEAGKPQRFKVKINDQEFIVMKLTALHKDVYVEKNDLTFKRFGQVLAYRAYMYMKRLNKGKHLVLRNPLADHHGFRYMTDTDEGLRRSMWYAVMTGGFDAIMHKDPVLCLALALYRMDNARALGLQLPGNTEKEVAIKCMQNIYSQRDEDGVIFDRMTTAQMEEAKQLAEEMNVNSAAPGSKKRAAEQAIIPIRRRT